MSNLADSVTLRLARPDEHGELEELQRRASVEIPEYRDQLLLQPDAIYLPEGQIANGQVIVAELHRKIAGFAAVVGGELDGLFVEPDLWGQGIGRVLVDAATHHARRRGLALSVTANPRARPFYESCGFSVEGEEQTRFGLALRMTK
jgi:GNAT superfamily N-acetyltransferase